MVDIVEDLRALTTLNLHQFQILLKLEKYINSGSRNNLEWELFETREKILSRYAKINSGVHSTLVFETKKEELQFEMLKALAKLCLNVFQRHYLFDLTAAPRIQSDPESPFDMLCSMHAVNNCSFCKRYNLRLPKFWVGLGACKLHQALPPMRDLLLSLPSLCDTAEPLMLHEYFYDSLFSLISLSIKESAEDDVETLLKDWVYNLEQYECLQPISDRSAFESFMKNMENMSRKLEAGFFEDIDPRNMDSMMYEFCGAIINTLFEEASINFEQFCESLGIGKLEELEALELIVPETINDLKQLQVEVTKIGKELNETFSENKFPRNVSLGLKFFYHNRLLHEKHIGKELKKSSHYIVENEAPNHNFQDLEKYSAPSEKIAETNLQKVQRKPKPVAVNNGDQVNRSRSKTPWQDDEVKALENGIGKYGRGWASILSEYGGHFHPSRTNVDLKDKARNEKRRREKLGVNLGAFGMV